MKVTHLNLGDELRTLAVMRAAELRLSLTEYVSRLVVADAEKAGVSDFLGSPGKVGGATADEGVVA